MKNAKLFKPGKIGNTVIKNRIVMGPMEFNASNYNGEFTEDLMDFYENVAKNGAGLIITGYCSVIEDLSPAYAAAQLMLTNEKYIAAISRLARRVHKYGTKLIIQTFMEKNDYTAEELKTFIKAWGNAARYLYAAGADGIEILAAGGNDFFLINSLISPATNHREDEYGGSFENRMRFLKEIIEEIRNVCPPEFLIDVRFCADEFHEDGYGLEEGVQIAKKLEQWGVDCLNVQNSHQAKNYYIFEPIYIEQGWKSYILKAIKEAVSIPVMGTNVYKKPEQLEQSLQEELVDFPVACRMFLVDPEWPTKAYNGQEKEVKTCIGCLHCLNETDYGRISMCALNPTFLRLREFPDKGKDLEGKKIAVVGSGPAGMEAAIECAKRGASVVVYEKKGFVGGAAMLGGKSMDKKPLKWLISYYETIANKLNISMQLNKMPTVDELTEKDIFAVFVATGAKATIPGSVDTDGKRIFSVEQALEVSHDVNNKNIVIVGGGMTGCETAVHYAKLGNKVTVVEMCDELAKGAYYTNIAYVQKEMEEMDVHVLLKHSYVEVKEDTVQLENMETKEQIEISADMIIFSLGGKPENSLFMELTEKRKRVYNIGDSVKVGRVAQAVQAGFESAYVLDANILRP